MGAKDAEIAVLRSAQEASQEAIRRLELRVAKLERWLGRFGGLAAVGLYCSSGAALLFGWREYMPTFTDASLIAAGSGALLWALLATKASSRPRTWAGLAGFAAIEIATLLLDE